MELLKEIVSRSYHLFSPCWIINKSSHNHQTTDMVIIILLFLYSILFLGLVHSTTDHFLPPQENLVFTRPFKGPRFPMEAAWRKAHTNDKAHVLNSHLLIPLKSGWCGSRPGVQLSPFHLLSFHLELWENCLRWSILARSSLTHRLTLSLNGRPLISAWKLRQSVTYVSPCSKKVKVAAKEQKNFLR